MVTAIVLGIKAMLILLFIALLGEVLYAIEAALCKLIDFLQSAFNLFAGLDPVLYSAAGKSVEYDPTTGGAKVVSEGIQVAKETTLSQIFFSNSTINTIYWDMAIIGIAMVFGFAIFAVAKKMFDVNDRMKQTLGMIIGNSVKAILLICAMNAIVSVALTGSQVLLNQMNDAFEDANGKSTSTVITYDEADYAAMLRCINTISNYSVNKAYNSRYNLNKCYNEIREDLEFEGDRGKFQFPYRFEVTAYDSETGDAYTTLSGEDSWQSVLYDLYVFDSGSDVPIDEYNEERNDALLYAMDVIRNKADFKPLESYTVTLAAEGGMQNFDLGRMVMLMGTVDAANDDKYNKNMSFTDDLRGDFLYGYKNIYKWTTVKSSFCTDIFTWHHLLTLLVAIIMLKQMFGICLNAIARIFNMIFLYLVSPPFIAAMPLDDGGKAKQWTTAFIIQTFSLFGIVLSMRLFTIMAQIVCSDNLVFFPNNSKYQMMAQVLFLLGAAIVLRKAGGMITGILADNAGMQAINAGDMMGEAAHMVSAGKNLGVRAGFAGLHMAKGLTFGAVDMWGKSAQSGMDKKEKGKQQAAKDQKWDQRFKNLGDRLNSSSPGSSSGNKIDRDGNRERPLPSNLNKGSDINKGPSEKKGSEDSGE